MALSKEEQLAQYPDVLVNKVINICNNVFYSDYLKTGIKLSDEQIKDKIKSEIEKTYVAYFGKEHAGRISSKINQTKICFCYASNSMKNSISGKLDEILRDNFNKKYGVNFKFPQDLEEIAKSLETNGLEETSKKFEYGLEAVLGDLGVTKESLSDPRTLSEKISLMKDYGKKYNATQYSVDPAVQEECQFVRSFCNLVYDKTRSNLFEFAKEGGLDKNEALEFILKSFDECYWRSADIDPIACKLMPNSMDRNIMLDHYRFICAFAKPEKSECYFGVSPEDVIIIHEFGHIIDNGGLEKGHREIESLGQSRAFASNTILNEVITDYSSEEMCALRQKFGMPPIVSAAEIKSSYSDLFPIMKQFLDDYKFEINECRMRPHPAEELARIIGDKQFEDIAREASELYSFLHDRSVIDIKELSEAKSGELSDALGNVNDKSSQPKLYSILDSVQRGGENFAGWLNAKGYPHLGKLTNGLFSLNNVITNVRQNHVRGTLPPPIFNVSEYNASLSANQMTMK